MKHVGHSFTEGRTAYLDMANWLDLAEQRVNPTPLEKAIAERRIVTVLSLPHLLEIASNDNDAGRERVAHYMDSIASIAPLTWIKNLYDVMRLEAIASFSEVNGGAWDFPPVFFDSFHETLPDYDPKTVMFVGEGMPRCILEMIHVLPIIDQFKEYLSDCLGYPELRNRLSSIRKERGRMRFDHSELRSSLAHLLPGSVEMPSRMVVAVDSDLRQRFSRSANLDRCHAFRANWAYHEGANLDPAGACRSDIGDLWHLAGVAYCDVAFVDKRTAETLRKGEYDKMPKRNSEFSSRVRGLGSNDNGDLVDRARNIASRRDSDVRRQ